LTSDFSFDSLQRLFGRGLNERVLVILNAFQTSDGFLATERTKSRAGICPDIRFGPFESFA
jgi:hypothetical protein